MPSWRPRFARDQSHVRMTILRWVVFLPVAVCLGLLATLALDLIIGLTLLIAKVITWPPPQVAPPWIYFIDGVFFAVVYLLAGYSVAPARKSIVAGLLGVLTILFVLPALWAGSQDVTLYPAAVNQAGVTGVSVGVLLGWVLIWRKSTVGRQHVIGSPRR